KLADARDSKSRDLRVVWVQFPPPALLRSHPGRSSLHAHLVANPWQILQRRPAGTRAHPTDDVDASIVKEIRGQFRGTSIAQFRPNSHRRNRCFLTVRPYPYSSAVYRSL